MALQARHGPPCDNEVMKRTLKRLLPPAIKRAGRRYLEAKALKAVPPVACDASHLSGATTAEIADYLGSPELAADWERTLKDLEHLPVTAEAEGVNPGDRRALWAIVKLLKPRNILEIGTHIGASTLFIASAQRDLEREGITSKLTTVDVIDVNDPVRRPWISFGATHAPRELIELLGRSEQVRFVSQPSHEFLAQTEESYDLIFLDGSHEAQNVYPEVSLALQRLAPGGHVLLHDYFPKGRPLWSDRHVLPGVWLATERLRQEGAQFQVRPLGNLPWPTKLGSKTTSLAVLEQEGTAG